MEKENQNSRNERISTVKYEKTSSCGREAKGRAGPCVCLRLGADVCGCVCVAPPSDLFVYFDHKKNNASVETLTCSFQLKQGGKEYNYRSAGRVCTVV